MEIANVAIYLCKMPGGNESRLRNISAPAIILHLSSIVADTCDNIWSQAI